MVSAVGGAIAERWQCLVCETCGRNGAEVIVYVCKGHVICRPCWIDAGARPCEDDGRA